MHVTVGGVHREILPSRRTYERKRRIAAVATDRDDVMRFFVLEYSTSHSYLSVVRSVDVTGFNNQHCNSLYEASRVTERIRSTLVSSSSLVGVPTSPDFLLILYLAFMILRHSIHLPFIACLIL